MQIKLRIIFSKKLIQSKKLNTYFYWKKIVWNKYTYMCLGIESKKCKNKNYIYWLWNIHTYKLPWYWKNHLLTVYSFSIIDYPSRFGIKFRHFFAKTEYPETLHVFPPCALNCEKRTPEGGRQISVSEPGQAASGLFWRSQCQSWRKVGARARISLRSESEPELISPCLNWSSPEYPRLAPIDISIKHYITGDRHESW